MEMRPQSPTACFGASPFLCILYGFAISVCVCVCVWCETVRESMQVCVGAPYVNAHI